MRQARRRTLESDNRPDIGPRLAERAAHHRLPERAGRHLDAAATQTTVAQPLAEQVSQLADVNPPIELTEDVSEERATAAAAAADV